MRSRPTFFQWYRFSLLRVQFGRELVRLITRISLDKFLNNMMYRKSLKNFSDDFSMACRQKMFIFGHFKACISNFTDYNLYQRKLNVLTRKKYALYFLIRPLDFYLETREDELSLHESPNKNLDAVSKNKGQTSSA